MPYRTQRLSGQILTSVSWQRNQDAPFVTSFAEMQQSKTGPLELNGPSLTADFVQEPQPSSVAVINEVKF